MQPVLQEITRAAEQLLPATGGASIVLWNARTEAFTVSSSTVPGQLPQLGAREVRREGGATRWIVEHHQPVVVSDVQADRFGANRMLQEYGLQAYVGVPLLSDGEALGVLYALDRQVRQYTEDELGFRSSGSTRIPSGSVQARATSGSFRTWTTFRAGGATNR